MNKLLKVTSIYYMKVRGLTRTTIFLHTFSRERKRERESERENESLCLTREMSGGVKLRG